MVDGVGGEGWRGAYEDPDCPCFEGGEAGGKEGVPCHLLMIMTCWPVAEWWMSE